MLLHMRTSVDIPDLLLRRAKKLAREQGLTLRQLLVDSLRAALERSTPTAKYRMKDCSFGKGGLVSGLAWSDTERIDELAYGDRG
jgi:hypothetical protein